MIEYFNGPIAHVHLRTKPDVQKRHVDEFIQFTPGGFLEYARKFTGNNSVKFIDTDHPLYDTQTSSSGVLVDVRKLASENLRKRSQVLSESEVRGNMLTGVEVDIVSQKGELNIEDQALSSVEVVTASFHYDEYVKFAGLRKSGKKLEIKEVIDAYLGAMANPNVDVLGHPTRDIQQRNRDLKYVPLWIPLFEVMAHNNMAFELNFSYLALYSKEFEFEKRLIMLAHELNVPFIIGFDIHSLSDLGSSFPKEEEIDERSASRAFEQNRGAVNFKFLSRVRRNIGVLQQLNIAAEDVVNSSEARFKRWLQKKNGD